MTITDDRTIRSVLKGRVDAGPLVLRDSKVTGLELLISRVPEPPKRSVCTWSFRFRVHGQQKRLNLGRWDAVDVVKARELAKNAVRKIAGGGDPHEERRQAKAAVVAARKAEELKTAGLMETVCALYIDLHAKPNKRSWRQDDGIINRIVLKHWRGRTIDSITREELRTVIERIAEDAPVSALRTKAMMSKLWSFAMRRDLVKYNPLLNLTDLRHESEPIEAYDDDDIVRLWKNTKEMDVAARASVRLCLLLGQRPNEVAGMQWSEVDLKRRTWTIPAARAKNKREHRVPLNPMAMRELKAVPRLADEDFVFWGIRGSRQQREQNAIAFKGLEERAKPRHALRSTAATKMAECGVPEAHISAVLNHQSARNPVTAGYQQYTLDDEKRAALLKWETALGRLVAPKKAKKVLRFRSA